MNRRSIRFSQEEYGCGKYIFSSPPSSRLRSANSEPLPLVMVLNVWWYRLPRCFITAAKMLIFSVFRGVIDIVHSDDPFVLLPHQLPFYHGFVTMGFCCIFVLQSTIIFSLPSAPNFRFHSHAVPVYPLQVSHLMAAFSTPDARSSHPAALWANQQSGPIRPKVVRSDPYTSPAPPALFSAARHPSH